MPHVCGDEPPGIVGAFCRAYVCPTYVGMNRKRVGVVAPPEVCPTYVGMNRDPDAERPPGGRMPHVCGDEPWVNMKSYSDPEYAPRMWG